VPREFLHYFQHQNSKFRHLIFFCIFCLWIIPTLKFNTATLTSYSATQHWGVHGKEWKEYQRVLSFYNTLPETKFSENQAIIFYMMMNLKQSLHVDQGDYRTPKEKCYKLLTFLSNGLLLYLQDSTNINCLKYFIQFRKFIFRNVQPVVNSLDQLSPYLLARSFHDIHERL